MLNRAVRSRSACWRDCCCPDLPPPSVYGGLVCIRRIGQILPYILRIYKGLRTRQGLKLPMKVTEISSCQTHNPTNPGKYNWLYWGQYWYVIHCRGCPLSLQRLLNKLEWLLIQQLLGLPNQRQTDWLTDRFIAQVGLGGPVSCFLCMYASVSNSLASDWSMRLFDLIDQWETQIY